MTSKLGFRPCLSLPVEQVIAMLYNTIVIETTMNKCRFTAVDFRQLCKPMTMPFGPLLQTLFQISIKLGTFYNISMYHSCDQCVFMRDLGTNTEALRTLKLRGRHVVYLRMHPIFRVMWQIADVALLLSPLQSTPQIQACKQDTVTMEDKLCS